MKINNKSYVFTYSLLIIFFFSTGIARMIVDVFDIQGLWDTIVFFYIPFYKKDIIYPKFGIKFNLLMLRIANK